MKSPIALTRRGGAFLAGAAALWLLWLLVRLHAIWYLVAFFAALVAISVLWAIVVPALARISVHLDGPGSDPSVGDSAKFTASAAHLLRGVLSMRVDLELGAESESVELAVHGRVPAGRFGAQRTVHRVLGQRGLFVARVAAATLTDPLGLVTRRIGIQAVAEVVVLPRPLHGLPGTVSRVDRAGNVAARTNSPASDAQGSPAGAVREYRSGDALRQMHWKQSARQGQLLVNLYERQHDLERTLLLVTSADTYAWPGEFELAVSAAASVALGWLRPGRPVRVQIGGHSAQECRSRNDVLRCLALAGLTPPAFPYAAAAQDSFDGVVTGVLSPGLEARLITAHFAGTVWATRGATAVSGAPWRTIPIPQTASEGPPAPGSRPSADSARSVRADRD